MIHLNINGTPYQVDVEPNTPLLWVIREQVGLTGTKYGCGIGRCGACTVHLERTPGALVWATCVGGGGGADHHDRRSCPTRCPA